MNTTPDRFEEPGFVRLPIQDAMRSAPATGGIVFLIASNGKRDVCVAGWQAFNIMADLNDRVIFRAKEAAICENADSSKSGLEAEFLRTVALKKKYGVPPENTAPPGWVGEKN